MMYILIMVHIRNAALQSNVDRSREVLLLFAGYQHGRLGSINYFYEYAVQHEGPSIALPPF